MCSKCLKFPFLTILSGVIALISAIIYGTTMGLAIDGFEKQINAFLSIGTSPIRFIVFISTTFLIAVLIIFLISSIISTIKMSQYDKSHSRVVRFFSSTFFTGPLIYLMYFTIFIWAILFSLTAIALGFYFIFISTTYIFCGLVDTRCFDFSVFLPVIVEKITNKKVDLTFCSEKKERLCSGKNNMSWNFIIAFLSCLVALMSLVHCLMILTNKWSRMRGKKKYFKRELQNKNELLTKLVED
uniref:MARVEL domain-containing protein n=1 Tax=Strongyloides papillosus TaxID=174720 RepID=A0A0N5B8R6_STREA